MRSLWLVMVAGLVAAALARAADDDLDIARHALADKLYDVAERRAAAWLGQHTDARQGGAALQVLVQALAEEGRHADVLLRLDAHAGIVAAAPDPGLFAFWRALAQLETGRFDLAQQTALAVAANQTAPEHFAALRRVAARARVAAGDINGALRLFEDVDRSETKLNTRLANLLEWGTTLESIGKFAEALAVIERQDLATGSGLAAEQGALLRARLLLHANRNTEAEETLRRLAATPAVAEAIRVRAWIDAAGLAQTGGRTNDALSAARAAVEAARAPDLRRAAAFRLADLLLAGNDTIAEGETRMKAFVREYPEAPEAREAQLRLAAALLRCGLYERAAAEYGLYVETFGDAPHEVEALAGRAQALAALGRFGEAANLFQKAHDTTTNRLLRAECLFRAADALLADNRPRQAAQAYRTVYDNYPASPLAPRALFQAADSLERGGDQAQAEAVFRQVGGVGTNSELRVRAQLRLAALQSSRDAVDEAVATYTAVLNATTDPLWRGEALLGRGRANYRAYRFEPALRDSGAAAEAAPSLRDEARFLDVMNLYGLRRDEEARQAAIAFLAAFPQSPRLPDMLLWLAKHEFNRDRFEDARTRCLEYVARWPQGPWADAALLWAGRASFRLADYTRTVELMARLWKEFPRSPRLAEGRFLQADALVELARFDEAVLLFDEIVTRYPESDWVTSAWGRKGDCLFSMGTDAADRFAEAMQAYREMMARRDATPEMLLQAEFKLGRCLEKLKRTDEAMEQYYTRVILRFIEDRSRGIWYDEAAATWFTRAAFQMADLLTQKGQPEAAGRVLQRVVQAGVPGQVEARQRLERLQNGGR
jgi:TolA-binding protein